MIENLEMNTSPQSGNFQEPVRPKESPKCPHHKQKDVFFVCLDCKTLLCTTCGIKSLHKPHNIEELTEVAAEKTIAMPDFVNDSENSILPQLKLDLFATDKQLEKNGTKFKKLCVKIKKRGRKCKQEIDGAVLEWTSLCEKMERVNMELLSQQKKIEQTRYDVLFQEVEECKKTLLAGSLVDVYDTEYDTRGNDPVPEKPILQTAEFYPSMAITYGLKYILGTFTSTNYELLSETTVVEKFPFPQIVRWVHPTREGHALMIPQYNTCEILLLDRNGEVKEKIQHGTEIKDISRCPITREVWFCSQKTVHVGISTSAVEVFKVDREALSVCVTLNGFVVVGTLNRLTVFTPTGSALYSTTREETGICEPINIAQCSITSNLAVVCREENGEKEEASMHIIVYDRKLKVLFTYKGYGIQGEETVTPDKFGPGTIVYDSFGNLVVGDWKRNTIELISGSGQYIKTLHKTTGKQGAIGMEPGNVLWSQSDGGEVKLLKYYIDN